MLSWGPLLWVYLGHKPVGLRPPCEHVCARSLQLCLTLCDPMDCSSLGSSVHGILQTRILEWVAIPSLGHLPNSGIEPGSPALQADSLAFEPPEKPSCLYVVTEFKFVCLMHSEARQYTEMSQFGAEKGLLLDHARR